MDIVKLIKLKESQTLEFKRDTSSLDSILKSAIAFANTVGGMIKNVFSRRKFIINTEKLLSLGILAKKGKNIFATNGGVILFGKPDIRQKYFPFAEVRHRVRPAYLRYYLQKDIGHERNSIISQY